MARDFPGTAGNGLSIGDVAAIDITGTVLSIACWFRPDVTSQQRLVSKWGNQYLLEINASGKLQAAVAVADILAGTTTVSTGVWQHGAFRKNGTGANSLVVFLNGASDGSATSTGTISDTATSLNLGDDSSGLAFNGRLAEVGIWDVALSDAEIAALAKGVCPLLIRRTNLKGYWPIFGSGSPEPDLSGNVSNATITGTLNAIDHAPVGRLAPMAA